MKNRNNLRKRRITVNQFSPVKAIAVGTLTVGLLSVPLFTNAFSLDTILSELAIQAQQLMVRSAVRVSTQQTAVSANQIVDNQTRDSEMIVAGIQSVDKNIEIKKAILNSGTNAALPDSAFCTALEEREQTDLNRNLKDFNVFKYMQDVSGKLFSNSTDEATSPYAFHLATSCGVEEAKMGVCNLIPNGLQYGDIDTAFVFSRSRLSEQQATVALNYSSIASNNVVPVGLMECSSSTCVDFQNKYMAGSTLSSLANYSVANNVMQRTTPNSNASAKFFE